MKVIKVNSPEYKAFAAGAILSNQRHILEQLKWARESGSPCIRLIENFFDHLMETPDETEEEEEERERLEYTIITGKEYYDALCRLD